MKPNIGTIDRAMRILLGLAALGLGAYFRSPWGLVGLIPLLTGVIRICPLYPLLGLNTCRKE